MATQVLMPQLGEAVDEATITKWLKSEGDAVNEYEPLVEVNTDKVDTEIPAPASGTLLKILIPEEGTTVKVGTLLALIGQPGELITENNLEPEKKQANTTPEPQGDLPKTEFIQSLPPEPTPKADSRHSSGFISPVVSKIAAQYRVNLNEVQGTGLGGRITKKDVLSYIETRAGGDFNQTPATISQRSARTMDTETLIPHTNMRKRIADHMVMSRRTSPHVTTVFEADLSKIVAHRAANKSTFEKDGTKLTFTAYFVAATAMALKTFPLVNSSWSDQGIILNQDINIGMATSLGEDGLIVPVIKKAANLSLLGIARNVTDLANRARSKQLQPDEVSGGTFTITNHGVSGSLFAMPIINQPQCAILGVGKLQKRVVVLADDTGYDTIAVRPMVYLTLTFDHRILDGAAADYFLHKVVTTLENWT